MLAANEAKRTTTTTQLQKQPTRLEELVQDVGENNENCPAYEEGDDEHGEADEEGEEEDGGEEEEEEDEDERLKLVRKIHYSERYNDERFEYRHVILPRNFYADYVDSSFKDRLLSENEWRSIGIQQSPGWIHYELHEPEPHIFLFRRPI